METSFRTFLYGTYEQTECGHRQIFLRRWSKENWNLEKKPFLRDEQMRVEVME